MSQVLCIERSNKSVSNWNWSNQLSRSFGVCGRESNGQLGEAYEDFNEIQVSYIRDGPRVDECEEVLDGGKGYSGSCELLESLL